MQGQRIGQPLAGRLEPGARHAERLAGEHAERAGGQAKPDRRLVRGGAAGQHRLQQVRAELPGQVGRVALVQHVQRGEPRGLGQGLHALVGQRALNRHPQRPQHLLARVNRHRDAWQHVRVEAGHVDRAPAPVQRTEDPAFLQHLPVPLRHLPAEYGLDPPGVGLFLAAGERQHPRGPVLDGHRGVHQRADRVGEREQVARRASGQVVGAGRGPAVEQRPEQHGDLEPRCGPGQAQQRDAVSAHGLAQPGADLLRRLHHQGRGAQLAQPPDQVGHLGLGGDAHAEQQLAGRDQQVVMDVEDRGAGHFGLKRPGRLDHLKQRGAQIVHQTLQSDPRPSRTRVPHLAQDTEI